MIEGLAAYPGYHDFGMSWSGPLPAHWSVERGKWLFRKVQRDVRPEDEVVTCFRDGTVTLRRNRRVRGFTESLKEIGYQGIRKGDLVIHAMDAFAGAIGVSDADGKGSPVYAVCQPKCDADSRYYAHVVREMARTQWVFALAKGIRERSTDFRFDTFASQFLPIPPPDEQAAIVRFLDHADRRIRRYIRAKRQLIALLNEQKQAIVHRAVTRGLDPNVRLKPSGVEWLGHIPKSWGVARLKSLVSGSAAGPYGSSLTKSMYTSYGYRVYGQQQVIPDDFSVGDYYISEEKFHAMQRYQVHPGDILISVMGTVGRVAVVPDDVEPGIINPRLVRYHPKGDLVRSRFLQLAIHSPPCRAQLSEASQGSTMDGLNMGILGRLWVAVPPLTEQDRITASIRAQSSRIDHAIGAIKGEIALVAEYRIRLVADVVTGKLDAREAAARLPEEIADVDVVADDLLEEDDADDDAELDAEPEEVEA